MSRKLVVYISKEEINCTELIVQTSLIINCTPVLLLFSGSKQMISVFDLTMKHSLPSILVQHNFDLLFSSCRLYMLEIVSVCVRVCKIKVRKNLVLLLSWVFYLLFYLYHSYDVENERANYRLESIIIQPTDNY